ncbi:1-deoxy-D-xylulose-5-phosphate synthase [Streptomyces alboniger]
MIVDVNRLGQRGPTRHEWHVSAYADRFKAFDWHTVEVDGHDVDAIDRAFQEAASTAGQPTVILARTLKGKGVAAVDREGKHGKPLPDAEEAIAELGGEHRVRGGAQARRGPDPARRTRRPPRTAAPRGRRRRRHPRQLRRRSPTAFGAAATWWPSTGRWGTRHGRSGSPRSTPSATSSATSPSSSSSPPPSAWPRAARCRTPRRSPRSSAAPTTSCAWRRSAARGSTSSARTRASPSARTGPRRWGSKTWRPSARSTAPRSSTLRRPPDRAARRPDGGARRGALPADVPRGHARHLRPRRGVPRRRLQGPALLRRRPAHRGGRRGHRPRGALRRGAARGGGRPVRVIDLYSVKPVDRRTLREAAERTGCLITVEDHREEGGIGDAVMDAFTDGGRSPRTSRGTGDAGLGVARGAAARRASTPSRSRRRHGSWWSRASYGDGRRPTPRHFLNQAAGAGLRSFRGAGRGTTRTVDLRRLRGPRPGTRAVRVRAGGPSRRERHERRTNGAGPAAAP